MTGLKVLFVRMHKRYYQRGFDRRWRRKSASGSAPRLSPGWSTDVLCELARRGHEPIWARLDSRAYLSTLGARERAEIEAPAGIRAMVVRAPRDLRPELDAADAVILRKDHPAHARLFERFDPGCRRVVTVRTSVGHGTGPPRFRPPTARFAMLVNDPREVSTLAELGIHAEVFRKPAAHLFYTPLAPERKRFDVVQVMHDTSKGRKRFDLFLKGLEELDSLTPTDVSVAVVGDARSHMDEIASLNGRARRVTITALGTLPRQEVRLTFLRSKVSVVTSARDANPRVIAESLASDVPVACAADITGGAFQIRPETGALFEPTPRGLALTLIEMLSDHTRFRARENCITIGQAADQIERLVGG